MATITDNPKRARRIADAWGKDPTLTEAEVAALVDAELEAEAAGLAEQEARSRKFEDSFNRMTRCSCCRVASAVLARDGLCDACRPVVNRLRAERLEAEDVNGKTRRQHAEALLALQATKGQ